MSRMICRVCGGMNESEATKCSTCGVVFASLPDDMQPVPEETPGGLNNEPATDNDDALDWLRKLYSPDEPEETDPNPTASDLSGSDASVDPNTEVSEATTDSSVSSENTGNPEPTDLLAELFPEILETVQFTGAIGESDSETRPTDESETSENYSDSDTEHNTPVSTDDRITEIFIENEYGDFETHAPQRKWDDTPTNNLRNERTATNPNAIAAIDTDPLPNTVQPEDDSDSGAKGAEREEDFIDFSVHRPQRKWDEETPREFATREKAATQTLDSAVPQTISSESINENVGLKPFSPQSKRETTDIPETGAVSRTPSAPKKTDPDFDLDPEAAEYIDFSIHRPQRKWDLDENDSGQLISGANINNDTKAVTFSLNDVSQNETITFALTDVSQDEAIHSAITEVLNDSEINERIEPSLIEDCESCKSADESFDSETQSDANEYVDFSIHRPQRKWDDEPHKKVTNEAPVAHETQKTSNETLAETTIETAVGESLFGDEPSLVKSFLEKITTEKTPKESPDDLEFDLTPTESEAKSILTDATAASDDRNDPASAAYTAISDSWTSPADREPEPLSPEIYVDAEKDASEAPTPSAIEPQPVENFTEFNRGEPEKIAFTVEDLIPNAATSEKDRNEEHDEIPWNLFDKGEMKFPTVPGIGNNFSKEIPKTVTPINDYQERMVASILEKVFHYERRNPTVFNPHQRPKQRGWVAGFALLALIGIVLILSGLFKTAPLPPVRSETLGNADRFASILTEIPAGTRVRVELDFSTAGKTELALVAETVVRDLLARDIDVAVIATDDASYSLATNWFVNAVPPITTRITYLPGAFASSAFRSLNDRDAPTILFSANALTAQRRIELNQIFAPNAPLLLIASQQSAPMMRPFILSGQIKAAIFSPDEKNALRGEPGDDKGTIALWYLIALAFFATLIGRIARVPFEPVIDPTEAPPVTSEEPDDETGEEKGKRRNDRNEPEKEEK